MEPVKVLKAHVALRVKHVAGSVEFYRKLFGVEPVKVAADYAKFDVVNPPLNFTLNRAESVAPGALSHLGLQVGTTEEVLAIRDDWRQGGLETRDEMKTECCYALQDKAWVSDPDGNEWEVFVALRDDHADAKAAASLTCCAPACCSEGELS